MYYHLIPVVKYRRKVFDDPISDYAKSVFEKTAPSYNISLPEWNHDVDHVHIMFKAQPDSELSRNPGEALEGILPEPELLSSHGRGGSTG